MRSAIRKLCSVGAAALQPHKLPGNTPGWAKPVISKRVAKVLRKQAVLNGTYGSFDASTGTGWDASWDQHVLSIQNATTQLPRLQPPKQTSRERTREARAKKIEALLEPVDEHIEQYYQRKADKKPPKTFENHFKVQVRRTMKR